MRNRIKNLFMAGVMLGALGLASVVQAVPVWAATVEEYARQCAAKGGSYNVQNGCVKTEAAKTITTSSTSDCTSQGGSVQNVSSNGTTVTCRLPAKKTEIDGPWKTTPPTDGGGQEYKGPDYNSNGGGDGTSPTESDIKYTGDGKDGYSYGYGLDSKDTLSTSVLDCSDSGNGEGIFCILNIGLTVLTWGVGIAGTLGIVICGIQYLTARDSVDQAAKAKNRLVNIIVGLVIYAVMWGFLTWLIPGGLF
ncbi:hypothetical protein IKF40_00045 [Candidatus Saccharibacteria bacterium]|nr:hypothetical protein [Candidatus Saccharibacteria bacterium]MBR2989316.1 hypothetical protein [Candidatus Saccharibacteria bacterium]